MVLCVDEQSNLVVDGSSAGEEFFDAQGNPAPVLKPAFDAAMALERNRKSTELAVAALAQAGVIRPWEIKVKSAEGERPISGLHRVDEAALRALPDETFLNLRKTSALPIAYTQMLSMSSSACWSIWRGCELRPPQRRLHRQAHRYYRPYQTLSMTCWRTSRTICARRVDACPRGIA